MSDYRRYPPLEAPAVQVLVGDTWHDGWLEAWRKESDEWRGYVRWSDGMAQRLGWYDQDVIRKAG